MEKTFEGGKIAYRLPNYAESIEVMGHWGLGTEAFNEGNSDLVLLGRMLKHMKPFITSIDIEGISTYAEILDSREYAQHLSTIAKDIIGSILEFSPEKKN